MKEHFLFLHFPEDDIVCPCGNTPHTDGFFPCNSDGEQMEPTLESNWDGLYICQACSRLHRFLEEAQ